MERWRTKDSFLGVCLEKTRHGKDRSAPAASECFRFQRRRIATCVRGQAAAAQDVTTTRRGGCHLSVRGENQRLSACSANRNVAGKPKGGGLVWRRTRVQAFGRRWKPKKRGRTIVGAEELWNLPCVDQEQAGPGSSRAWPSESTNGKCVHPEGSGPPSLPILRDLSRSRDFGTCPETSGFWGTGHSPLAGCPILFSGFGVGDAHHRKAHTNQQPRSTNPTRGCPIVRGFRTVGVFTPFYSTISIVREDHEEFAANSISPIRFDGAYLVRRPELEIMKVCRSEQSRGTVIPKITPLNQPLRGRHRGKQRSEPEQSSRGTGALGERDGLLR